MNATSITAPTKSHLLAVIRALAVAGWRIRHAPEEGRLVRNGQRLCLRSGQEECRLRLFVYKITGSGRDKPHERRIEITSTYQKDLRRLRNYRDVVLGYDVERDLFVGVEPRRISHGGPTGNASSFFDVAGLDWDHDDEILIRPRTAKLFPGGLEFHAFLRPSRIAEYLFNFEAIHAGTYGGAGLFAGFSASARSLLKVPRDAASGNTLLLERARVSRVGRRVGYRIFESYEKGDIRLLRRAKLSPQQFLEIKRRMEENGRLGEEFVLNRERRALRRAGRLDLSNRVRWVSQESVCEGFDILSFAANGDEKWIEVKATSGKSRVFEMSDHEWRTCCVAGDKYYVYRVSLVRNAPEIEQLRNLRDLETRGRITRSATGWRVSLP